MERVSTIMSQILPDFMNRFFEFLAIPIFPSASIHFGWFIIHGGFAFLLYYLLKFKFKEKRPFLFAFIFLFLFEVFEWFISYPLNIILRETFFDTFFDLVIGVIFIWIAWLVFRNKKVSS